MRTGLLVLLLSGCAVTEPAELRIAWTPDSASECLPWSEGMTAALDEAAALWALWGVPVERDDTDPGAVVVCHTGVIAPDGKIGRASNGRITVRDESWAVLTHEIGHLVLPGTGDEDHLPYGEAGIMAAQIAGCRGSRCGWSDADIEHLTNAGLSLVVVELDHID